MTMLRVLTLNAGSLIEPDWPRRRIEIAAWLDRLDPDIVCLQEIWDSPTEACTAQWIVDAQPRERWHLAFGGVVPGFWRDPTVRFGSAVLSRWPIDAANTIELPVDPHPPVDHPGWRMVPELLHVRTAGIDAFSTHLAPAPAQAYQRIRQVLAIDGHIRRLAVPGRPVGPILCGDFNAEPDSDEIRFLCSLATIDGRSTYYQEAWRAAGRTDPGFTSDYRTNPNNVPFNVPMKRIDYIFVGDPFFGPGGAGLVMHAELACHEALTGIHASDHFGVVADIRWPQRPS